MEEVWKDIEGYEGLYQVSNMGRVKSVARYAPNNGGVFFKEEKILKQVKNKKGYCTVSLSKRSKKQSVTVHRLVAKAFVSNPNSSLTVNHINEIKTDNRAENLEWMSISENVKYGNGIKRSSISRTNNPKRCKPVIQYSKDGNFIKEYMSIKIASDITNIESTNITACCHDRRKFAGGYIWKFKKGD